jgi:polysaccharide pyruvyl transferase WcaK-like protein
MLHIGFDFWGAGNLGDDLMLSGFLGWLGRNAPALRVSALCAHDIGAMRRRVPSVEWHAADPASRRRALEGAKAWLGLGGSPFQSDLGPWLLEQMCRNMEEARSLGIPCFLVGVGLNNREALSTPEAARAVRLAERVWVRDAACLRQALAAGLSPSHVGLGADLAHLALAGRQAPRRTGQAALVIHTRADSVSGAALSAATASTPLSFHWLCQEVRALQDSERELHAALPAELRARVPLLCPGYSTDSLEELITVTQGWELMLSSRYHSSLAAAWAGSRLCIHERNDKLGGLREELGAASCRSLTDARELRRCLLQAVPVEHERLEACHARADNMLTELMHELASTRPLTPRPLPLA